MKRSPLERKSPLRSSPESVRAFQQRARTVSAGRSKPRAISPASAAQRAKAGGRSCVNCGNSPCDPAHLTPRSLGGCDSPDCIVSLCRICHVGLDERSGPQASIDLSVVLALPEFAAERAHMALHASFPVCMKRLTGMTWAPISERAA